ncbi:MAG: diguanylate cyclase [Deltaproteobacteria bacterium]|nr:diguanylate cyclase [Deltaproteobacteria bacterium]
MEKDPMFGKGAYLSVAIIETLKELSTELNPITPSILHNALLRRPEFARLFLETPLKPPLSDGMQPNGEGLELVLSSRVDNGDSAFGEPDPPCPRHLRRLHEACLLVLSELQINPGEDYSNHLLQLRETVEHTESVRDLILLSDETIDLLRVYAQEINGELSRFTHLMAEVAKNLVEMERHLFASFSHAQRSYKDNRAFNMSMEHQFQDMVGSCQISRTLAELRNFVAAKLHDLRRGIEIKQKEDERQIKKVSKEMRELKRHLVGMKEEMLLASERTKALEQEVLLDPLTGIHNRRAYEQRLMEELKRYQRYGQTFSMLLIDLDHFKSVNDHYGHWAGDRCLVEITKLFRETIRETDFLARYGGEEFVALLLGIEENMLHIAAERLRRKVEKAQFRYRGVDIPITVSIGGTCVRPGDRNKEELFNRVDGALYKAKNSGRNCVFIS